MPVSVSAFVAMLLAFLPSLVAAIVVLIVGWLVAFLISKLVENLLHRTSLDDRLARSLQGGTPDRIPVERIISTVVFWLIMLFVILIFLQTLNLGGIAGPISLMLTSVLNFLPRLLAAAALLLLAWIIASVLRLVITRVMNASAITRRATENANVDARNRVTMGQTIGNVVYWLVFLLFLPAILGALDLTGTLAPVSGMVNSILGALPNILGFIAVLVIGYFVARIIRSIVGNLLASIGVDRLGERTGVNNAMPGQRLSDVLATIVFVLIMIPIVIAALNVLNIPAVSQPAANMLNGLLNALPAIFGAFLIIAISYFVARLVGSLVTTLLASVGFNRIFSPGGPIPMTGFATDTMDRVQTSTRVPREGMVDRARVAEEPGRMQAGTTPAEIVGYIVMVAIIIFAVMQAAQVLGFAALTTLLSSFVVLAVNVLFGLVIIGLGLWLANTAYRMVSNTGVTNAHILAQAARIAIIFFAAALALRQMGIGQDIVNLAFGLMLGAIAVAAAIAFGFGGRDVAHGLLERWREQLHAEASRPQPTNFNRSIPQTGSEQPPTPGSQYTPPGTPPRSSGTSDLDSDLGDTGDVPPNYPDRPRTL